MRWVMLFFLVLAACSVAKEPQTCEAGNESVYCKLQAAGNVSLGFCSEISDDSFRERCFISLARFEGDVQACDFVNSREDCLLWGVYHSGGSCEGFGEGYKTTCLFFLSRHDVSVCSSLPEHLVQSCFEQRAKNREDVSVCSFAPDKEKCRKSFDRRFSFEECVKFASIDFCASEAAKKGDLSHCSEMSDEWMPYCIALGARMTDNLSLCSQAGRFVDICYGFDDFWLKIYFRS